MNYTLEEIKSIVQALKETNPWVSNHVKDIKQRIKSNHLNKVTPKCCYCLRDFTGEFRYDIDIEHILPKSKYKYCIFDLENLSIACKRCNMKLKNDKVNFLAIDLLTTYGKWKTKYFNSNYYYFVHPNLDNVYEHLRIVNSRVDDLNFKKYFPVDNSEKGRFTYDYFELNELESDSLTQIQGSIVAEPKSELAKDIAEVLKKHGF
ncbi:hypothetical protein BIT28_07405 [Photobacterium proteolyticum]|uniref:HNH domain-containing protein n=1 Tax=Photobacterium proteolyticum TaxID=1903952 RepID=A0A1Q9GS44_9GAMM|nr:HNH endonuclease [Photobacterium proteolyticum]OLQ77459.1 hypothetical protein BIT28_07405 [Photobacterium proteolyticum]